MSRALWISGAGWLSGVVATVLALVVPGAEAMPSALFFGSLVGFVLHGAAIAVAIDALVKKPGPKRPAVLGLVAGVAGFAAALVFFSFWVAVATNGGA